MDVIAKQIQFFPFGDVHFDTRGFDEERFDNYIKITKSYPQDECLYLLMGDALDFSSTSELRKLQSANLHETTYDRFDRMAMSDIKKFCKKIAHMKGRMVGVIGGNHQWKFANGKMSDEVIAEEMQCKYLGSLSCIRITIFENKHSSRSVYYDIIANHGKAGGKLLGTSINQVADLKKIFPTADVYLMGHDHKLSATPDAVFALLVNNSTGELEVKQINQRLIRTGSFKKTYTVGVESYEIDRIYTPSILGAPRITLTPVRYQPTVNGRREDVMRKNIESHV